MSFEDLGLILSGRARWTLVAGLSVAFLSGCAHDKASTPSEPSADVTEDPLGRVRRENAALRRRVQMLEDRVLHLEQGNGDRPLPVVRLEPESAPTPTEAPVAAQTWQSTTAGQATHPDPSRPDPRDRRSRSIAAPPSLATLDPDEQLGGYAPAPEELPMDGVGDEPRQFRLVGSRLAELSKTERKPEVESAPVTPAKTRRRRKPRGHKAIVARYEAAMALLQAGDAGAAEVAFDAFVVDHPRHDYADNALYWKGEAAYDQRHYADALAAFTQVVERYGGGNKAPDALLKIGLCYHNIGDGENARDVLSELISAYPGAPASGIARLKLAELGL